MVRKVVLPLFALLLTLPLLAKDPFTFDAMMKLKRISEPAVSPDGRSVVFTVMTVDMDRNARPRQIWSVPVAGGKAVQLTREGSRNERPKWSPDGKSIAFASNRGGSMQVWTMDPDGGNAKAVTQLATEASGHIWSPDGKHLVFTSDVYPECSVNGQVDNDCNKKKLEADEKNPVKARTYTTLLYRHWTDWQGPRRRHIVTQPLEGGVVRDLTPGPGEAPPFSLGGPDDYTVSPDSKEVCYAANLDPDLAFSTNGDLFVVPIEGGEAKKISTSPGADASPQYSPDGKWIAWRSQARAGYESDRWRLIVMNRESQRLTALTESLDRWVTGFTWHPDSQRIAFTMEDRGRQTVHLVPATGGGARLLTPGGATIDDIQFTADGKTLIYTETTGASPTEIYRAGSNERTATALTHLNDDVLNAYQLTPIEEANVAAAGGASVHYFAVKPHAFDATKKYPVLFLIHGGPQGHWGESFSYRWNQQVFAAAGFLVVMPNPRGSTGYGQKFIDEINGDWGGKAYEDIMAVADAVAKLPYADADRMAAAGGSYGGYMVNWILGRTNRFKALVSHAGVYDLRSMGGETEELWFSKWEHKGMPWESADLHERFSPSAQAASFRTPTLVIHGELDFRVPYGQGLQLFTALQAQKVPSKLLIYPDEGHWIMKPKNAELWYRTFLDWVKEWTTEKK